MIIIIEGIDGAGKSMLAAKMSKQTGYPVIHRSYPKNQQEKDEMMNSYIETIKKNKNVIFDRSWYSEMAYGPVTRDEHIISYPQMYELEKMLAKNGAMIIYATGSPKKLWKQAQDRGEDHITDFVDFMEIFQNYENIMLGVPHIIPVVTYEYKGM